MNRSHLKTLAICLCSAVALVIAAMVQPDKSAQAAGVVGTGTPGSCTEAAFDTALVGGGTITFNCGAAPKTIIFTSAKVITSDTEIRGGGLITLSGGNATPLFSVTATLTLRDITLTRGFGSSYGTIRNFGTINLIDSQITYGSSDSIGGAIDNNGTVNLTNSTLAFNSTNSDGGALNNSDLGDVHIENSQIYSNTAKFTGGGIRNVGGLIDINDSQIYGNEAWTCALGNEGGGIWNSGTLTLTQSTIANNNSVNGGGIYNEGTLTVEDTTLENNNANCANTGDGGGILNNSIATISSSRFLNNIGGSYGGGIINGSPGQITIDNSTFSKNHAAAGGGIISYGTMTLTNSTVYTNTANFGAGIYTGWASSSTLLINVTISDNSSNTQGGGIFIDNGLVAAFYVTVVNNHGDAGVLIWAGQLILKNSIFANNSAKNCQGDINTQGFNISDDYSCLFNQPGDRYNTDPQLGPLADNGGPTLTHLPKENSPAIDGGQCMAVINTDQRGVIRPQDAACDIGAVEVKIIPPTFYIYLPIIVRK